MDSIGEILRVSREKQNYTLEQVARDTRISKRYVQALEEEEFAVFPGETYLIGFLRNYSEYLGLNPEEMISLYKNTKLQEQPIPMEELIHGEKKPSLLGWIAALIAVLALIGVGSYFLIRRYRSLEPEEALPEVSETTEQEFQFKGESEARWFNQGDRIVVFLGDRDYDIEITSVKEDVALKVPGGTVRLELSEKRFIDLDLDDKSDVRIVFNDLDAIGDVPRVNLWLVKTASLQIEESLESAEIEPEGDQPITAAEATTSSEVTTVSEVATATPPVAVDTPDRLVILEADAPRIFRVEISFRGNCLLRYLLDGRTRDQRFFQKAEIFTLDNVRSSVKLWISNAGAAQIKIEGREVTVGRPGQVVTKQIRWVTEQGTGLHQLELSSDY